MVEPGVKTRLTASSRAVPLESWMSCVFGDVYSKVKSWERAITSQEWFTDDNVQAWLTEFCSSPTEDGRYAPLIKLNNYLMSRALASLDGVSYPIGGLTFVDNSSHDVKKNGTSAARRRPDIILAPTLSAEETARRIAEQQKRAGKTVGSSDKVICRRGWDEIVQWWELKRDPLNTLLADLDAVKAVVEARAGTAPKVRESQSLHVGTNAATSLQQTSTHIPHEFTHPTDPPLAPRKEAFAPARPAGGPGVASGTRLQGAAQRHQAVRSKKRRHDEVSREGSEGADSPETPQGSKRRKVSNECPQPVIDAGVVQSATYALEVMSNTDGTRLHCLGHIMKDDSVTPWYYDASGMVCSAESISMIREFPKFAAFVIALASLNSHHYGAMPSSVVRWPSGVAPPFPHPVITGRFQQSISLRSKRGPSPKTWVSKCRATEDLSANRPCTSSPAATTAEWRRPSRLDLVCPRKLGSREGR